jgi:Uma2 family endonuclease
MPPATLSVASPRSLPAPKTSRPLRKYTLQEYLQREERSAERYEYYDGYLQKLPMAKGPHNIISANVITALHVAIDELGGDYTVFANNQKVYLPALNFGLYPDALVISQEPVYWDDNELLLTNPLLIVEVLSKSTKGYDRGDKFLEYKTLPSFKEYVLIEQNSCLVEVRFREEADLWRITTYTELTDVIQLKSIGCSLTVGQVYRKVAFV